MIIVAFFLGVVFIDFLPLLRKGQKKEAWIYTAAIVLSFSALILSTNDVRVPSPTTPIKALVEFLFHPL